MEITFGTWRFAIEQIPPSTDELSQQYDFVAPKWHQSIKRMGFIDAYASVFAQIKQSGRLAVQPVPLSVLDVGIGTGGLSQALAQADPRPIDLTGIDISPKMLAQAKHNLDDHLNSLALLQQNIAQLRLKDDRFDMVMGAHVLEHLPDMRSGLTEMIRVAKPGAPILLIVTRKAFASAWLHLFWQIKTVRSSEMLRLFAELGLEDVRTLRFAGPLWCNWMSVALIGTKPHSPEFRISASSN